MGYLKPTTSAQISKYPRLTILGYSGTFEKCQNGWVQVSGEINITKGLKEKN